VILASIVVEGLLDGGHGLLGGVAEPAGRLLRRQGLRPCGREDAGEGGGGGGPPPPSAGPLSGVPGQGAVLLVDGFGHQEGGKKVPAGRGGSLPAGVRRAAGEVCARAAAGGERDDGPASTTPSRPCHVPNRVEEERNEAAAAHSERTG